MFTSWWCCHGNAVILGCVYKGNWGIKDRLWSNSHTFDSRRLVKLPYLLELHLLQCKSNINISLLICFLGTIWLIVFHPKIINLTWSENVRQFTWHANSDAEVKKTDYFGRNLGWCHKKMNNPVLMSKDIQKLCNWMWDPVFFIHQSTAKSKREKHRDIKIVGKTKKRRN